jgi:type II restriction enzyme
VDVRHAKEALDRIIAKARVHLYKPIQIAEILHQDRVYGKINFEDVDSYRTISRKWRDQICLEFLGRTSTSSARYQDDVFNENAAPPSVLAALGIENRKKGGIVEAYIYRRFIERYSQMTYGLDYCTRHDRSDFSVEEFINLFWEEPGLKRSIDKIYEIIVYSLFSSLVDVLGVKVKVSLDETRMNLLHEFEDFTSKVMQLSTKKTKVSMMARVNRVGVTNAADRGLDMWANFGLAIQVKHLTLNEELAESVVSQVSADRIVIVCKAIEQGSITALLSQIGWKARIQSIVTEDELFYWYEKALRGKFGHLIGDNLLSKIQREIEVEFPATDFKGINEFMIERDYLGLSDAFWS